MNQRDLFQVIACFANHRIKNSTIAERGYNDGYNVMNDIL